MKIFFVFFIFLIDACTIFVGKRESLWTELDSTQAVSCDSISPPLNHIGLMDVMLIKDEKTLSFLLKSKSRLGENKFFTYKLPVDASINEESFLPIDLNPDSEWAGSGKGIWGVYESTLEGETRNPTEKVFLRLHSMSNSDNNGKKIGPISLTNNPDKIYLKESKKGLWLIDQKDANFNLRSLNVNAEKPESKTATIAKSFYAMPAPFNVAGEATLYVVFLEETGGELIAEDSEDEDISLEDYLDSDTLEPPSLNLETNPIKNTFKLQAANSKKSTILQLPTEAGVESWSIQAHAKGFYLAYFEGDSLVGQARLHIGNYLISNGKAELVWLKTFPMDHIHVGDLEWVELENDKVQLHFLKWLDGEATLASFSLAQSEVIPLENKGVFPSGSTLMDVFTTNPNDDLYYSLLRHRSGAFWQFDVCQLQK
ncbi:MAG: hypothetical protein HRU09_05685 [Oligoflexales bacterium]|nr:hypothetical protein [Oligoflexales bacterium]